MDDFEDNSEFLPNDDDYKFRDQLVSVLQDIASDLNDIGLRCDVQMNAMPRAMFDPSAPHMEPDDTLRSGHKNDRVAVFAVFESELIPEICFSERVLNPELYETNKQIRAQLPTEEEVELEASIEELKRKLEGN